MARVVCFEGADSTGKGTQSRLLVDALRSMGYRVTRVEHTKDTFLWTKRLIYGMLASGSARRWPTLFQLLQFGNRALFQLLRLPKLLRDNDVVVLDRWHLSSLVYGDAEGINRYFNQWMYDAMLTPDLTLVLTGAAFDRPGVDDSYEGDPTLQAAVKHFYAAYALWIDGCVPIAATGTVDEVHARVVRALVDNVVL